MAAMASGGDGGEVLRAGQPMASDAKSLARRWSSAELTTVKALATFHIVASVRVPCPTCSRPPCL
eukprot:1196549-Prymnesium_polylepis.1